MTDGDFCNDGYVEVLSEKENNLGDGLNEESKNQTRDSP
jgi:hypothetical protein